MKIVFKKLSVGANSRWSKTRRVLSGWEVYLDGEGNTHMG